MKNVYALAISANRTDAQLGQVYVIKAAATFAVSGEEALGKGIESARREWPAEKGWQAHQASQCEIPWDAIHEHDDSLGWLEDRDLSM